MPITIINHVADKGDGQFMQDTGGYTDHAVWVIDGAPALWDVSWTDEPDDTKWLVERLSEKLPNFIDNPDYTISQSIKLALDEIVPDEFYDQEIDHYKHPTFTIAVVRGLPDRDPEYYVLCDSEVIVKAGDSDGNVDDTPETKVFTDQRYEEYVRQHRQTNYANKAEYEYRIQAIRARNNKAGGYWVGSPDGKGIDHGVSGQFGSDMIKEAIVTTDGLTRMIHDYNRMNPAKLFDRPLDQVLGDLRSYENNNKTHIFKNSDDVFAYKITLS